MSAPKFLANDKTDKRYIEIMEFIEEKDRDEFRREVYDLKIKKIISEEGEYDGFYVTEEDLIRILDKINNDN